MPLIARKMKISDLPPGIDLNKPPMIPPPPGVTPNFTNPESRAWTVYVTSAVCLALTFILFAARMYSKFFVVKKRSIDDCKYSPASLMPGC